MKGIIQYIILAHISLVRSWSDLRMSELLFLAKENCGEFERYID
ncbi:MAG: hypothetical protein ACI9Y8_000868 [Candidatus Omnitrophota bacterium]|jgi:hypothetical protein